MTQEEKAKRMNLEDTQALVQDVMRRFKVEIVDPVALIPVDVDALTPQSTFVMNNIIGINGVIYRAKRNTQNFPVVLQVSGSAFVVNVVNGKKAFVVSSNTINSDWEMFTDAAIEYWMQQMAARVAAIENTSPATAIHPSDSYGGYTVTQLLNAVATLMPKKVVAQ